MDITKTQLKQLILEEVSEKIVIEEIRSVIAEMQLDLSEEQILILEKSVLDTLKSAIGSNMKIILPIALAAFGSQIGNDLQILNDVGVTPGAAQELANAENARDAVDALKDKELQKLVQRALDRGTADLGVDSGEKKRVSDTDNFVSKYQADLVMATGDNGQPLRDPATGGVFYYVPYDNIDSSYTDFSTGKYGIDGKMKYYGMMDAEKLNSIMDRQIQDFGSFGYGKFKKIGQTADASGKQIPILLLNADFSAFKKAQETKNTLK